VHARGGAAEVSKQKEKVAVRLDGLGIQFDFVQPLGTINLETARHTFHGLDERIRAGRKRAKALF